MLNKRGIVIYQPAKMLSSNTVEIGGTLNPFELRKYLLYWDEIDYPDNNHVSTGISPDIPFLMDAKVAKRTRIQFPGTLCASRADTIINRCLEASQKIKEVAPLIYINSIKKEWTKTAE